MKSASLLNVVADQIIFYPGSLCENYLLMVSGSVRTQLLTESGRELMLYKVKAGDSCVLTTACLLGKNRYPVEGVTETDIRAFGISSVLFHDTLNYSNIFRMFVFNNFAERLSSVMRHIDDMTCSSIDARLSGFILDSIPRGATVVGQNLINKTHHQIAIELGTVREVVSRHLKRFEDYQWIRLSRGTIEVLDAKALNELSKLKR
jgi:CRP/FNR family transcriptional regulator, anaerobic regulatory protein